MWRNDFFTGFKKDDADICCDTLGSVQSHVDLLCEFDTESQVT